MAEQINFHIFDQKVYDTMINFKMNKFEAYIAVLEEYKQTGLYDEFDLAEIIPRYEKENLRNSAINMGYKIKPKQIETEIDNEIIEDIDEFF